MRIKRQQSSPFCDGKALWRGRRRIEIRIACLACLYPSEASSWERRFPVFGAVAGTVASLGAMEAIKVLAGLGEPLLGQLLTFDLRDMTFRKASIRRRPDCTVCGP